MAILYPKETIYIWQHRKNSDSDFRLADFFAYGESACMFKSNKINNNSKMVPCRNVLMQILASFRYRNISRLENETVCLYNVNITINYNQRNILHDKIMIVRRLSLRNGISVDQFEILI